MKIAVIDDEPQIRTQLQQYLRRYSTQRGIRIDVETFERADVLLKCYQAQYNMILMDICMEGSNGMEAAAKLRQVDSNVVLMFITNMAQYAVKGYEVEALDFILKPVSYETFAFKMDRAVAFVRRQQPQSILLRSGTDGYRVNISEVLYFEVLRHTIICHCTGGELSLRYTLRALEQQVEGMSFSKCNQCYLVNLAHVRAVKGFLLTLTDGSTLQISRSRKSGFFQDYTRYLGGLLQ